MSRVTSRLSNVDLPASPAQLAEVADQSFQAAKGKLGELWERTRIEEAIEIIRENASSVAVIQLVLLFIEGAGLEWNTRSTIKGFTVGKIPGLTNSETDVYVPNLALLLSSDFWAPATLWSLTSWVIPLVASYFVNLTLRTNTRHRSSRGQHTIDPLTFSIVKAILAYATYSTRVIELVNGKASVVTCDNPDFGPFSKSTVNTVCTNTPASYPGLLITAGVGILVSLYDAALKK